MWHWTQFFFRHVASFLRLIGLIKIALVLNASRSRVFLPISHLSCSCKQSLWSDRGSCINFWSKILFSEKNCLNPTFSQVMQSLTYKSTGPGNNTCTWFGEVGSCCCLPLLPQLACNILATTYKYYFRAQHEENGKGWHRMFKKYGQGLWPSSRVQRIEMVSFYSVILAS